MNQHQPVPNIDEVDQAIHEAKEAEEHLLELDRRALDTGRDETLIAPADPDMDAVRRHQFVKDHDKTMHPHRPDHGHHDKDAD